MMKCKSDSNVKPTRKSIDIHVRMYQVQFGIRVIRIKCHIMVIIVFNTISIIKIEITKCHNGHIEKPKCGAYSHSNTRSCR